MKRDNLIILIVLAVLAILVSVKHYQTGTTTGQHYVQYRLDNKVLKLNETEYKTAVQGIKTDESLTEAQRQDLLGRLQYSPLRTVGLWIGAFLTLATFSFLYKDNPFYKIAEHAFVGVSAAYWMVVAYWTTVVPNVFGKLLPYSVKFSMVPGLDLDEIVATLGSRSWMQGLIDYEAAQGDGLTATTMQLMDVWYIFPLIMGIMLLWRLAPTGAWIARWPLAFILGTTAGIRLNGYLESDFVKQIQSTLLPLIAFERDAAGAIDYGMTFYSSMNNILLIIGVACGIVYFFFSLEHKGLVGKASRIGIWVLMITFGAGFGYTVMGRIALLVGRFEFLVQDWLHVAG